MKQTDMNMMTVQTIIIMWSTIVFRWKIITGSHVDGNGM